MSKLSKTNRFLNVLMLATITIVLLYCVIASQLYQRDNWGQDYALQSYSGTWYRVFPNGEKQLIETPGEVKVTDEKEVVISTFLPEEISRDTYLCFRSGKQDMDFFIDGELRLSYSNKSTRFTGKHSPVARVFVELHPEDSGKELLVSLSTDSSYGGTLYEVMQGSQIAFWVAILQSNGIEFIITLFMLILSVIIIVIVLLIKIATKEIEMDLVYLAFGMLAIYAWILANSELRQMVFPNLSVVNDLAYFMVLLIPAPFQIYLNRVQKKRYSTLLTSLRTIVLCDFFICTTLHVLKIVDYDQSFIYMAIIDAVSVLLTAGTLILDLMKGKLKEYQSIAFGFLAIVVCGLVQMVLYFMHILRFGAIVMSLGMSTLLICEIYRTIRVLQNIQKEKIEAVQAKEARGKFLANMSHEIRTPINSVLGLDTMILRESKEPGIRKYAMDIQSSGRSLLALINDILDFSKIESGKMELVYGEYDITSIINDVVNMIRPKAIDKELEFIIDIDENIPCKLYGDDVRVKQILVNLLTNAVKYTHKGRIKLTVRVECVGDDAVLRFSVKDTGIGIKPEDISKLSEEFVRIEESRNKNIEGTGLGMNIVISLLQLMGSRIEVDSVYGEGSNFYFTIVQPIRDRRPIGDINERLMNFEEAEDYVVSFCIPDCRLLVVDDNSMNRNVFINLLKEMLCPIDEAESGAKCLELVKENKYDIIFMDHMMPEMDGVETFHRMQEFGEYINAKTPVVILTANAISGAKEAYLSEGFTDYLSKPIDADKLEKMIGRFIPDEKKRPAEKKAQTAETSPDIELPFIDGVDWKHALLKLKTESLLMDSLKNFSNMAPMDVKMLIGMYEKLTTSESQEAFDEYRIKVHSMKSNVATIGADHLAGVAKYLEYAAKEYDKQTIDCLMPLFEKEWNKLKIEIDEAFGYNRGNDKAASEGKEIDLSELEMLLDVLKEAMDETDLDRADAIVEELSEYSYPEEQMNLLESIKMAVLNIDAEQLDSDIQEWNKLIKK